MNISNKKLKKALEHYKNGEYETALKICEKFLEKDYSNEEALSLEGDILYKLGRIDDAIVTWKINSEYNQNEEATNRLALVDKERKAQALSYTNIQNMSSEDRMLLENAYRENIELKREVESSSLLKDESSENETNDENNNTNDINKNLNKDANTDDRISSVGFEPIDDPRLIESDNESKEYEVIDTNIDEIINEAKVMEYTNSFESINIDELKNRMKHLDTDNNENSKQEGKIEENNETIIKESKEKISTNKTEDIKVDEAPLNNKEDKKVDNLVNTLSSTTSKEAQNKTTSSTTSKKKIIIPVIAVVAVIVVALSYSKLHSSTNKVKPDNSASISSQTDKNTTKPDVTKPETKPSESKPVTDSSTSTDSTKPAPQMLTSEQATKFTDDINYLISADSIDGINNVLINTPKDTIPESAMPAYNKAVDFMKNDGITYYYDNGMNAYNNGDYATAIAYFTKAEPYAKEDFRGPTMLFLTGASYTKLDNSANAINTYKQFLSEYPNSENYTPDILYFLATYYSEHNDIAQAKQYANELSSKYPSSMYNNENIQKIIK